LNPALLALNVGRELLCCPVRFPAHDRKMTFTEDCVRPIITRLKLL